MKTRYIYNVTINIDDSVHDDWLHWMRTTHIPDVLATGMFDECKISKVLSDDPEGTTYAIQYIAKDRESLALYQNLFAPDLQKEHLQRYANKFVAFRTVLEIVEEF
ncbi:hypothetical protein JCM31826_16770 [Thermaurantimonas aggregans]|uniref:DUF4286 domain-containing protein n=1 Tax=Thermaurantimonas aggregans TaxID=2173829 RepID=A0A401XME3_9FLAO|nr:DUF4286 family protein [Thermaurantimonas aggregans]MCX8148392.1 DUF4286 family protein [Thermaurantimonas aggregans]GCD78195.1 hypothetical protein JCM31826_16770 [Thermaurantimonas aggregans]